MLIIDTLEHKILSLAIAPMFWITRQRPRMKKARLGVETSQLFQGNATSGWDRACDAVLQRRTAPPWWWEMPAHSVTLTINMLDLIGLCTSKETAAPVISIP